MMLLALFFSCMVAGSFACSDDQCKDPKLANELMDVRFLPNEEELKTLCPKVITFLECEKEYFECPGQTLEELATSSDKREAAKGKAMMSGMNLVRELCEDGSSLQQDYLASVECFRNYIDTAGTQCRQDIDKPIEDFFSQIYNPEEELSDEAFAEIRCLSDALEVACVVDNLGDSCGSDAQRITLNALERMKDAIKVGSCMDVENAADLKARILDFLELDEDRRSKVQSVFDLFKRRR